MSEKRCNKCGRFVNPRSPGVAWCQAHSGYDLNDPTYRCSPCADKHGVMQSNCNPASGPWQGRNALSKATGGSDE